MWKKVQLIIISSNFKGNVRTAKNSNEKTVSGYTNSLFS
jgi:hypothetical protein